MIGKLLSHGGAIAFAALAIVALQGPAAAGSGADARHVELADASQPVKADAIKAAFAGNSVEGTNAEGVNFKMYLAADGVMKGVNGKGGSDSGKWELEGDTWCRQWSNWQGGKRACSRVYLSGSKVTFKQLDGKRSTDGTIVKGNSTGK